MRERTSSVCRRQQLVGAVALVIPWGSCWQEMIVQSHCKPAAESRSSVYRRGSV